MLISLPLPSVLYITESISAAVLDKIYVMTCEMWLFEEPDTAEFALTETNGESFNIHWLHSYLSSGFVARSI
jgi:hypothetical protein